MGRGLQRARAAAEASRTGTCPVCLRPIKLSSGFGRILPHGPVRGRCPGSGELPARQAVSLQELQGRAQQIARDIAADRLPVDAGNVSKLCDVVAQAHKEGQAAIMRQVLDAYQLFLDSDDLDEFRDMLTGLGKGLV